MITLGQRKKVCFYYFTVYRCFLEIKKKKTDFSGNFHFYLFSNISGAIRFVGNVVKKCICCVVNVTIICFPPERDACSLYQGKCVLYYFPCEPKTVRM